MIVAAIPDCNRTIRASIFFGKTSIAVLNACDHRVSQDCNTGRIVYYYLGTLILYAATATPGTHRGAKETRSAP